MDHLIFASLSHTHYYWYEVSMLKVSAVVLLHCFGFVFVWCPCMAINNSVSVQYNGGFSPDIILLTQCYYHRGTEPRLNAMKRFCICSLL